jgi:hypothetical protein
MAWLTALLTLPVKLVTAATNWFLGLSLPARIAWSVGVVQFLLCLVTLLLVIVSGGRTTFQAWWTPGKGLQLLILLLLVPIFVYYAMRLWLHEEVSRWRDIEKAWREVRIELDRQQIDLRDVPLFLILGTDGRDEERAIMQMAPVRFVVTGSPPGSSPLHVYAGQEAAFVCLSGIGQACSVAEMVRRGSRATQPDSAVAMESAGGTAAVSFGLSAAERGEASDRLTALCERVRNTRQPVAPINGIAVVVPLLLDDDPEAYVETLGTSVAGDLLQVTQAFGLRVPVTFGCTVPGGMSGWKELGTLLPAADRGKAAGQAFSPGLPPSPEDVAALAINAGGRLSDVLGELLADPRAVGRPVVNRALLRLTCRMRTAGVAGMTGFLQKAVDFVADATPPLLSGCYVMSPLERGEGGFFGRGFFERLLAVQGDLEWTQARLERDRRYGRTAAFFMAMIGLLVLAIAGIVAWRLSL